MSSDGPRRVSRRCVAARGRTIPRPRIALVVALCLALRACSSGSGDSKVGERADNPPTARPQVVNGGTTNVFREGSEVLLTGKFSQDFGGPVIGWRWEQISGPGVALIEATAPGRSFTAPAVDEPTQLQFRLTVEDAVGQTDSASVTVTVVPARDADKFLSLDIGSGLTFDSFRVVAALAGGAATGPNAQPFTLAAQSYLVYPPRTNPTANCELNEADFAAGIPLAVVGGCVVEPLADLMPTALPTGGTGIEDAWPADLDAPVDDAREFIERWWNPRFLLPIPRLDVREFNQRFVDSGDRDRMLDLYLAHRSRIVLDLQLTAPLNQQYASLIVMDGTNTPVALANLFQGQGHFTDVFTNSGSGFPTRLIVSVQTLYAAIAGRESTLTSEVYYRTVDPLGTRATLNAWLQQAGFASDTDGRLAQAAVNGTEEFAHAVYLNNFDLGFGRQMYSRTDEYGNVFSFVQNFRTLEAAIKNLDSFVTVVMEYSPLGRHSDPTEKFVKFFTYIDDGSGNEQRVASFDFDGRGERYTPGNCTTCHGGAKPPGIAELLFDASCGNRNDAACYAWPDVNREGASIANGNLQGMFLPWDIKSLLFADTDPAITDAPLPFDGVSLQQELERDYGDFSQSGQAAQLKRLNQAAYDTYEDPARTGSARRLLEHWYGGVDAEGQLAGSYDSTLPVAGWLDGELLPDPEDPSLTIPNPDDASAIYLEVYAQHCRMCHTNQIDPGLRFDTYRDFISQEALISQLVFGSGTMPGARLTMDRLWAPFHDGPAPGVTLGEHIGKVLDEPARTAPGSSGPVVLGLDPPSQRGDTAYLNGAESTLAETYDWALSGPPGSGAILVGAKSQFPMFRIDQPGNYEITLTLNAGAASEATTLATMEVANREPIASNDIFSFDLASPQLTSSVLAGPHPDFDPDRDALSASVVAGSGPQHGSLVLGADGSFAYAYTGDPVNVPESDGFDYVVTDPYGEQSSARVTILLNPATAAERPTIPTLVEVLDASMADGEASVFQTSLSWTAASDDVQVLGYNVYRNGERLDFVASSVAAGTQIDYLDASVNPDGRYFYHVTAFDGVYESLLSNAGTVETTPSLRQNVQSGWGDASSSLWQVSGCVGCHRGAPGGLTLRGPTAEQVYAELTEDAGVAFPRVNTDSPVQSLLLCKPLIATDPRSCAHGGGDFLVRSSPSYQTLMRWIRNGAPNN